MPQTARFTDQKREWRRQAIRMKAETPQKCPQRRNHGVPDAPARRHPVFAFFACAFGLAEPGKNRARSVAILPHPDGMIIGHRLAPIGHDEIRIDRLGFLELGGSALVFEIRKQRRPARKRGLCVRCAGVFEIDGADAETWGMARRVRNPGPTLSGKPMRETAN